MNGIRFLFFKWPDDSWPFYGMKLLVWAGIAIIIGFDIHFARMALGWQ